MVEASLQQLLAGHGPELARLERGDAALWQALLEHLVATTPPVAPRPFVQALLARDDSVTRWLERAKAAAAACESEYFTTIMSATRPWKRWLFAGLAAVLPADAPAMLEARFERLFSLPGGVDGHDEHAVLAEARLLAADAARVWGPGEALGRVYLLLHRRATEAQAHEEALAAAQQAERLFDGAGDAANAAFARRLAGATQLRLGQLEQAFALLDAVLEQRGPLLGGGGTFVTAGGRRKPRQAALDEAATIAAWADRTTPEWVRALGGLAERFADAKLGDTAHAAMLGERFERAVIAMLEASAYPGDDLAVVIRQATERKLRHTAARAREIGARLGITPGG